MVGADGARLDMMGTVWRAPFGSPCSAAGTSVDDLVQVSTLYVISECTTQAALGLSPR